MVGAVYFSKERKTLYRISFRLFLLLFLAIMSMYEYSFLDIRPVDATLGSMRQVNRFTGRLRYSVISFVFEEYQTLTCNRAI